MLIPAKKIAISLKSATPTPLTGGCAQETAHRYRVDLPSFARIHAGGSYPECESAIHNGVTQTYGILKPAADPAALALGLVTKRGAFVSR